MDHTVRIEGIYDLKTLKSLKEEGFGNFTFDFRPKSFNFIQLHQLCEILSEGYAPFDQYWLTFDNDPDFVINKIVGDLEEAIHKRHQEPRPLSNLKLEFQQVNDVSWYDSFERGYFVVYEERLDLVSLMKSKHLEGVVLSLGWLKNLHEKGSFSTVISDFIKIFYARKGNRPKLVLRMENPEDYFSSLAEYMEFDMRTVSIDAKVEVSYRQVNIPTLKQYLTYVDSLK